MSADNMLVCSPVGDKWWITQEFASDEHWRPVDKHNWKLGPFNDMHIALLAAHEETRKSYYEYGVTVVDTEIRLVVDVDEIVAKVQEVQAAQADFEVAHGLEVSLWEYVLELVASGAENGAELALAALQTRQVQFIRVYS